MEEKKRPNKILEVVFKITERCNINCTYCYMFNKGNEDYRSHPPVVPQDTIEALNRFVVQAVDEYKFEQVTFFLHGGEPLLIKPRRFEALCQDLAKGFPRNVTPAFGVQTNGMLLNEEWIQLFCRLRVGVGVSIDGNREYNDRHRLDHKGRATYARTVKGLTLLKEANEAGLMPAPGVICVINPEYSAKAIYRHLVDDLGLREINFLLPMETHDTASADFKLGVDEFLRELAQEWIHDANPYVVVRLLSDFFQFCTAPPNSRLQEREDTYLISISSDGSICADDELKALHFAQNIGNIRTHTFSDYLSHPHLLHLREVRRTVVAECSDCEWVGYCKGGAQNQVTINRYSTEQSFGNKSVFCDGLRDFYEMATAFLLNEGVQSEKIINALSFAAERIETRERSWYRDRYKRLMKQGDFKGISVVTRQ